MGSASTSTGKTSNITKIIPTTTLSARTPTKRTPIPTLKQLTTTAELIKSKSYRIRKNRTSITKTRTQTSISKATTTVKSQSTITIIANTTSPTIRERITETVTTHKTGNKPTFTSKVGTASKIVSSLLIHSNSSREKIV